MFISKIQLSRRTVLRGMGATLALPLLEAMVPALTATAQTAANPLKRFGVVFVPLGERPGYWTPKTAGTDFEFSPILKPLESLRSRLTVISELSSPVGGHAPNTAGWLSAIVCERTLGENVRGGTTIDQVIANRIGQDSPLASLEVATEDFTGWVGGCDQGYNCAYMNTITWKTPKTPLPMEINPRVIFERMFGRPGPSSQRLARIEEDRSILDSVKDDVADLERELGAKDRVRLGEYLDNLREVEQRIQKAEKEARTESVVPDAPIGVPDSYEDHALLLYDLLALAYEANLTRVFTFMTARDASQRNYPNIGLTEPHHAMSHHGNNPEKLQNLVKLNTYHVSLFAKFLQKLASTPDGDGSLLDHSLILYGSPMSESDSHSPQDVPTLVAGGAARQLKGNRHLKAPKDTPLGNLLVTVANMYGCELDRLGVSTGHFDL
jgi:hypothetical protein